MTARRALGDTLSELALDLMDLANTSTSHATSIELTLPIELRFEVGREDLVGDLPQYRRTTAFDAPPAGLTVKLALAEVLP